MLDKGDFKADSIVLLLSVLAVLVAATLTMATISKNSDDFAYNSPDPLKRAEQAAKAGIEAARWHVQCHGRTDSGGLPERYFVNGATYRVEWDALDLSDSTVDVRSSGYFSWGGERRYQVDLDSRIKISYLPSHGDEILDDYYAGRRSSVEDQGDSRAAYEEKRK
jgi:hypothetical protein